MNKKVLIGILAAVLVLAVAAAFAVPALMRAAKPLTPQEKVYQAAMQMLASDALAVDTQFTVQWEPMSEEYNTPELRPFIEKTALSARMVFFDLFKQGGNKQIDYQIGVDYSGKKLFEAGAQITPELLGSWMTVPSRLAYFFRFEEVLGYKVDWTKYVDILFEMDAETKKVLQSEELRAAILKMYGGATSAGMSKTPDGTDAELIELTTSREASLQMQRDLIDYYFAKDDLFELFRSKAIKIFQHMIDSKDYEKFGASEEEVRRSIEEAQGSKLREELDKELRAWKEKIESGRELEAEYPFLPEFPDELQDLIHNAKGQSKYWLADGKLIHAETRVQTPYGTAHVTSRVDYNPEREDRSAAGNHIDLSGGPLSIVLQVLEDFANNPAAVELFEDISAATGTEVTPDMLLELLMSAAMTM